MKLYTEEQVIFIIQEAREVDWYEQNFDFTVEDITSQLTPIELPSNEEINNASSTYANFPIVEMGFYEGAKWMKEQILNQNK